MNKHFFRTRFLFAMGITFGAVQGVLAGGIISYEIGTPDLGLAAAGYAARAQDAATAATNPAGMTRLEQSELMLGIQPFYANVEFSPNSNTTVNGNDGRNAIGFFPSGGAYFVYSVSPDFKLGLSGYGNFGAALKYDNGWVGRYYVVRTTLLGSTIAPSFAFRFNKYISFGAAFNAMYGYLTDRVDVNNDPSGLFDMPDGQVKFKDQTWGYGGTFGILFEPTMCTRIGVTYTTQTKLKFEDQLEFEGVLPVIIPGGAFSTPLKIGITVPQSIMTSFYQQLNARWALLGNVGWQDWKRFGYVPIQVGSANPKSVTADLHFKDTWHVALGSQYQYCDTLRLSAGVAYDSSMMSEQFRIPNLPVGAAWRFALGGQYQMAKDFEVGLGYELLWGGDLDMDQRRGPLTGRIAGEYQNVAFNFVGVNFIWKLS
ncbi:MAG: OmpP1/FadL family transporter [Candidatus Berkiellales bacterium]